MRLAPHKQLKKTLRSLSVALGSAANCITELTVQHPTVQVTSEPDQIGPEASQFVHDVLHTLPRLIKLDLQYCPTALPPPSTLPQLRQVKAELAKAAGPMLGDSFIASLAPYTPQLTSLHLDYPDYSYWAYVEGFSWLTQLSVLFSKPTTTLTHLTLHTQLTDALLGPLLDGCPGLQRLSVTGLDVQSGRHSGRQRGVKRLAVIENEECEIRQVTLARLPSVKDGRVELTCECIGEIELTADSAQVRHTHAHTYAHTRTW